MRVCYKWLKDYIPNLKLGVEEIAEIFTVLGFSVESAKKDDLVLDIPSNRPDCLSILGIARELAAITKAKFKSPAIKIKTGSENISEYVSVVINDKELCPRYTARVVKDIKVASSPAWLAERLEDVGIRPINNIVDITNFVLMETGQPLHAF